MKIKTQQEMTEIWEDNSSQINLYQKYGSVKARLADEGERVDTFIDGKLETTNVAKHSDVIVVGENDEKYIIGYDKFMSRYTGPNLLRYIYQQYEATGTTYGIQYRGNTIKFVASWGEEMICEDEDYLCSITNPPSGDIYRIEKNVFNKTYKRSSV